MQGREQERTEAKEREGQKKEREWLQEWDKCKVRAPSALKWKQKSVVCLYLPHACLFKGSLQSSRTLLVVCVSACVFFCPSPILRHSRWLIFFKVRLTRNHDRNHIPILTHTNTSTLTRPILSHAHTHTHRQTGEGCIHLNDAYTYHQVIHLCRRHTRPQC